MVMQTPKNPGTTWILHHKSAPVCSLARYRVVHIPQVLSGMEGYSEECIAVCVRAVPTKSSIIISRISRITVDRTSNGSPQVVQHQPAEQEKYNNAGIKDPLVLLRPSLNHSNRITANTEGVCHRI
jgi:hypothetical protein